MKQQVNVKIDPVYGVNELKISNEMRLWRAVIEQNLSDLLLPPVNKKYRSYAKKAIIWFSEADQDFYTVCEFADLNPQPILQKAHHLIVCREKFNK